MNELLFFGGAILVIGLSYFMGFRSGVDKNLKNFTAASSAAYGPGTNIGYRDEMLRNGGQTVGGTVFASPAPSYAPSKPPQKLIGDVSTKQKWDEINQRWNEIKDEEEKPKDEKVSIINNTTNVMSGGTTYAWMLPQTNTTPSLIDKVYNTYKDKQQFRGPEETEAYVLKDANKELIGRKGLIDDLGKYLGQLRKMERSTLEDKYMSPEEKQQKIKFSSKGTNILNPFAIIEI